MCSMAILAFRGRLGDCHWRVETNPDHGSGRQLDVLAIGGRDGAAGADHGAQYCALHAAENAADDGPGTGADTCRALLIEDSAALEHVGRGGANLVLTPAHRQPIERERELAGAFDASGLLDAADDAPN